MEIWPLFAVGWVTMWKLGGWGEGAEVVVIGVGDRQRIEFRRVKVLESQERRGNICGSFILFSLFCPVTIYIIQLTFPLKSPTFYSYSLWNGPPFPLLTILTPCPAPPPSNPPPTSHHKVVISWVVYLPLCKSVCLSIIPPTLIHQHMYLSLYPPIYLCLPYLFTFLLLSLPPLVFYLPTYSPPLPASFWRIWAPHLQLPFLPTSCTFLTPQVISP